MAGANSWSVIAVACLAYALLPGCTGAAATGSGEPGHESGSVAATDVQPVKTIKLTGDGWVNSVGVSPDGKRVFGGLGDLDDKYQLWQVAPPKMIFSKGSTENNPAAVSPFGDLAAYSAGKYGGPIILIDLKTGKEVRQLDRASAALPSYIPRARFSSKGDVLAVNGKNTLVGFNTRTGKEVFAWDNKAELFGLSGFFDGDRKIASSGPSGVVKVWDIKTGKLVTTLADAGPGDIGDIEVSSDGKFLATGGWGEPIKVWDTATWKKVREITPWAINYGSMVFIPKTNLLAYTAQRVDEVNLVDVTTGTVKHTLKGHKSSVIAMAVTPDGKMLVTAGRADRLVQFWDLTQLP